MVFGLFSSRKEEESCYDDDGTSYYDEASTVYSEKSGSTITTLSHHPRPRQRPTLAKTDSEATEATDNVTNYTKHKDDPKPVESNEVYPEVDYDTSCTDLFRLIQQKNWDDAAECAKAHPEQIKTWVYRREPENKEKMRWRLLPIHAMCVFLSPESLMNLLLDNFPKAAQMKDDQGMLPIHLACRNGSGKGVVKALLEAYPEGLHARESRKKRTPLDFAKEYSNFNKEGIILTLERFSQNLRPTTSREGPEQEAKPSKELAVDEVDYDNRTVLLRQIVKRDWKSVVLRAKKHPAEVRTWTVTKGVSGDVRFLPIHKACVLKPPSHVVEGLISAFPEGANCKDQDGWLPLHCAAFYSAPDAVVSTLLSANPLGCKAKDEEGRLPIHYACMKGLSRDVVEALLQAYPKSAQLKDDEGHTPLHMACANVAPIAVIEMLAERSQKCVQQRDDQGRIPLHHVCSNGELEALEVKAIVSTLLSVFPIGASIKDDSGKLALHYACENRNVGKSAIPLLMKAHKEGIHEKDGFGFTPLDTAKAMANEGVTSILEVLQNEMGQPAQVGQGGKGGNEQNVEHLVSRLSQLETTLMGFSQAISSMQHKLHKGEDPKELLQQFTSDLSTSGMPSQRKL